MPDSSAHLERYRQQRAEDANARVEAVLDEIESTGMKATFSGVARAAQVSRSWLYESTHSDRVQLLRSRPADKTSKSERQAASDASLRQRLADALDDNKRLRQDLKELKAEYAKALGAERVVSMTSRARDRI